MCLTLLLLTKIQKILKMQVFRRFFVLAGRQVGRDILGQKQEPPQELLLLNGKYPVPSPFSRTPSSYQTQSNFYEVVLGVSRETTSEVFLGRAGRKLLSLPLSGHRMII